MPAEDPFSLPGSYPAGPVVLTTGLRDRTAHTNLQGTLVNPLTDHVTDVFEASRYAYATIKTNQSECAEGGSC